MADFSEICPLFSTGVFNEITFPYINLTAITASGNALMGSLTCASATRPGCFTFGRTVVVTGAFLRRLTANEGQEIILLKHHTTILAAGTEFASYVCSVTLCGMEVATWVPMTVTEQTFTSNEVLAFTSGVGTAASAGSYDLILRYKEK